MTRSESTDLLATREAAARERLGQLQGLARTYRNWSAKDLAQALGRQVGRLVPESGTPKIDLVIGLARALDWTPGTVIQHILAASEAGGGRSRVLSAPMQHGRGYMELHGIALECRRERRLNEALEHARLALAAADTPERQIGGYLLVQSCLESMGRYRDAVDCIKSGLAVEGASPEWRLLLECRLANLLMLQSESTPALGLATNVLERCGDLEPTPTTAIVRACCHFTRGQVMRAMIGVEAVPTARAAAVSAGNELIMSEQCEARLSAVGDAAIRQGLVLGESVRASLPELDAVCGTISPDEAVRRQRAAIAGSAGDGEGVSEARAWAAVGLAATARRFITDEVLLLGLLELASATLRVHAIRSNSWFFAHRHFELELERRRMLPEMGVSQRALDATEARLLTGVLGQITVAREQAGDFLSLYGQRDLGGFAKAVEG